MYRVFVPSKTGWTAPVQDTNDGLTHHRLLK